MSEDIGRPLFSGYQASSGLGRPATLRDMDQPHGIEKVERHSERHQEQQMTPSSDGVRQGCPPMKRGRNIHVHRDRRIVARIPSGDLAGPRGRAGSEQEEPRERTDALANRTNLEPSQPLGTRPVRTTVTPIATATTVPATVSTPAMKSIGARRTRCRTTPKPVTASESILTSTTTNRPPK